MELLLIPSIFAIISLLIPRNFVRISTLIGGLSSLVLVIGWYLYYPAVQGQLITFFQFNENAIGLSGQMGYDGISLMMVLLTNIITFIIILANNNRAIAGDKLFNAMLFLMQAALLGVFTAMDGLLFYIFWEITLIPVFIIALKFGSTNNKPTLTKFFIYTFVGSLAMLASLIALKGYCNSFAYEALMSVQLAPKVALWIMGGFLLAFAIKIPLFPFHTWQPNTYTKSPMAGTMLLSALMLKMALYGMIRWMIPMAPEGLVNWQFVVIVLGLIGVVYAGVIAIKLNDIKKLFAFASISHVGLIAAGIVLFHQDVINASIIQMFNHSLVAVGLFLSADILENRLGTRKLSEMGGVAKIAPKFAFMFAALCFASVSVPFTSGFIGEFLLIKGLYQYHWVVGLIAGSTLVFGAVYTLRAYQLSMYGAPKFEAFKDLSWNEWLAYFLILVIILVIGICPQIVIDLVEPSIKHLLKTYSISHTISL